MEAFCEWNDALNTMCMKNSWPVISIWLPLDPAVMAVNPKNTIDGFTYRHKDLPTLINPRHFQSKKSLHHSIWSFYCYFYSWCFYIIIYLSHVVIFVPLLCFHVYNWTQRIRLKIAMGTMTWQYCIHLKIFSLFLFGFIWKSFPGPGRTGSDGRSRSRDEEEEEQLKRRQLQEEHLSKVKSVLMLTHCLCHFFSQSKQPLIYMLHCIALFTHAVLSPKITEIIMQQTCLNVMFALKRITMTSFKQHTVLFLIILHLSKRFWGVYTAQNFFLLQNDFIFIFSLKSWLYLTADPVWTWEAHSEGGDGEGDEQREICTKCGRPALWLPIR